MAASNLNLGKASGGILSVSPADGTTNTSLVLPASGTVVATDVAVTDNAIARYDGTTGKVQNSGVIIDDSNNVGIGTSIYTSNSLLNLKGTGLALKNDKNGNSNNWSYITNEATGDTSSITLYSGTGSLILDHSGNVGIGVTPSAWSGGKAIEIGYQGNGVWSDAQNEVFYGFNTYYNLGWKYVSSNTSMQYRQTANGHQWFTAPAGTAGAALSWTNNMSLDANSALFVYKSTTNGQPIMGAQYDANNYIYIQGRASVDTTEVYLNMVGGVKRSAILANGNFQSATNSYGSTSDAKLKENVVDTSDKLDKLMNVRVVNFNYIGDDQKQIGVIAQEVEKIFPGIVYETKDTKQVEVTKTKEVTDEEGNVTTEEYTETETVETGEVTKNVKYSVIYMMMLKGLQEMRAEYTAEINDLKARIETLEGAK